MRNEYFQIKFNNNTINNNYFQILFETKYACFYEGVIYVVQPNVTPKKCYQVTCMFYYRYRFAISMK